MIKPIITIAVPTYNRPDKLESLAQTFLLQASAMNGVDVVVCDNSNCQHALENKHILKGSMVRYRKNDENLGFHGNLLECIAQAKGEWLWIISDDDEVDMQAFESFAHYLIGLRENGKTKAVMLPFLVNNRLVNTAEAWSNADSLYAMVSQANNVPFILFSGVVIRLGDGADMQALKHTFKQFSPNDYMQVMLFAELIGDGRIEYWQGEPLQIYRPAYDGRFPLRELIISMDEVLNYLNSIIDINTYSYQKLQQKQLHGWIIWYVKHQVGEVKIQSAAAAKGLLLKRAMRGAKLKAKLLLILAIVLPRVLMRPLWSRLK